MLCIIKYSQKIVLFVKYLISAFYVLTIFFLMIKVYDTYDNKLEIVNAFTKYLNESCW